VFFTVFCPARVGRSVPSRWDAASRLGGTLLLTGGHLIGEPEAIAVSASATLPARPGNIEVAGLLDRGQCPIGGRTRLGRCPANCPHASVALSRFCIVKFQKRDQRNAGKRLAPKKKRGRP
jgi:hypothetical protein